MPLPEDMLEAFQKPLVVKIIALLFAVAGVDELAGAAYDQHRGVVEASSPGKYATVEIAVESQDPAAFRDVMVYKVVRALASLLAANFLLGLLRKQEQGLPFSPGFGGKAVDELERTLNGSPAIASAKAHTQLPQKLPGRNEGR
jgi:hypothetical protein